MRPFPGRNPIGSQVTENLNLRGERFFTEDCLVRTSCPRFEEYYICELLWYAVPVASSGAT